MSQKFMATHFADRGPTAGRDPASRRSLRWERLAAALVVVATGVACGERGSGVSATEQRSLPIFTSIDVAESVRAELVVDPTVTSTGVEIELTGDDNLLARIATTVEDGRLKVGTPRGGINPRLPMVLKARVARLERFDLSGSSRGVVTGVDVDRFAAHLSGSTQLRLAGRANTLVLHLSGSSAVDAFELRADTVEATLSGSSDVEVCAMTTLVVNASGSSDVIYDCGAGEVRSTLSGTSEVRRR